MRLIRYTIFLSALFALPQSSSGQFANLDELIKGGVEDANTLLGAYVEPFGKGFGADLNNGWFSTAKTHNKLGFDLTIMASAAIAPTADQTFDVSSLALQTVRLSDGNTGTTTSTIVGASEAGPMMEVALKNPMTGQDEVITSFQMPEGIGYRYIPAPMLQASVGTVMDTDVILRYLPEISFGGDRGNINMLGLGIKHGLNQWIPAGKLLPVHFAVLLGYTSIESKANLEVQADQSAVQSGAEYGNEVASISANSFTINALASKKLSVLTVFGGVGYEKSSTDLRLDGLYPITIIDPEPTSSTFGERIIQDLEDPVDLTFDGANSLRMTAGARVGLGFFAVHGGYTVSKYPVLNFGLGLSFR